MKIVMTAYAAILLSFISLFAQNTDSLNYVNKLDEINKSDVNRSLFKSELEAAKDLADLELYDEAVDILNKLVIAKKDDPINVEEEHSSSSSKLSGMSGMFFGFNGSKASIQDTSTLSSAQKDSIANEPKLNAGVGSMLKYQVNDAFHISPSITLSTPALAFNLELAHTHEIFSSRVSLFAEKVASTYNKDLSFSFVRSETDKFNRYYYYRNAQTQDYLKWLITEPDANDLIGGEGNFDFVRPINHNSSFFLPMRLSSNLYRQNNDLRKTNISGSINPTLEYRNEKSNFNFSSNVFLEYTKFIGNDVKSTMETYTAKSAAVKTELDTIKKGGEIIKIDTIETITFSPDIIDTFHTPVNFFDQVIVSPEISLGFTRGHFSYKGTHNLLVEYYPNYQSFYALDSAFIKTGKQDTFVTNNNWDIYNQKPEIVALLSLNNDLTIRPSQEYRFGLSFDYLFGLDVYTEVRQMINHPLASTWMTDVTLNYKTEGHEITITPYMDIRTSEKLRVKLESSYLRRAAPIKLVASPFAKSQQGSVNDSIVPIYKYRWENLQKFTNTVTISNNFNNKIFNKYSLGVEFMNDYSDVSQMLNFNPTHTAYYTALINRLNTSIELFKGSKIKSFSMFLLGEHIFRKDHNYENIEKLNEGKTKFVPYINSKNTTSHSFLINAGIHLKY